MLFRSSFLFFSLSLFFFLLSSDSVFFLFCSSPTGHSHVNPRRPKPRDHRRRSSITCRKAPPRARSPHCCYRRHPQLSSDLAGASKSASTATIQSGSSFFDLEALLAAPRIAPLAARSSIWKLVLRSRSSVGGAGNSSVGSSFFDLEALLSAPRIAPLEACF